MVPKRNLVTEANIGVVDVCQQAYGIILAAIDKLSKKQKEHIEGSHLSQKLANFGYWRIFPLQVYAVSLHVIAFYYMIFHVII